MVTGNYFDQLSSLGLAIDGVVGALLPSFPLGIVPPWGALFIAVSALVLAATVVILGVARWRAARAQREFAGTGEDLSEIEDLASMVWYRHTHATWDAAPAGDYASPASGSGTEHRDA
jgi:hypothetical protein